MTKLDHAIFVLLVGLLTLLPRVVTAACPSGCMAVYFSPTGGATDAVVRELKAATTQILVLAYSFTSVSIAKALLEAHKRGGTILAVLYKSNETDTYSAATFLVHMGIPTLIDDQHAIAHNKVVIDHATVITGSFNFTKAAEEKNAEKLLVIKEAPELVAAYATSIQAHAAHSHPYTRRVSSRPPVPAPEGVVHGHRHSKVSRVPGCKGYAGMNPASVVSFTREEEAQQAGYRRAQDCPGGVRASREHGDGPLGGTGAPAFGAVCRQRHRAANLGTLCPPCVCMRQHL